ncbi:MBL fold metallo-hydrolase [Streptomyces sp. NPDC001083]|uniref:MBL fold metallo-hydrolase n=1 Tax=Streptomyces sp. NPDC001083 TaxID=3364545 RepID=UPI0036B64534
MTTAELPEGPARTAGVCHVDLGGITLTYLPDGEIVAEPLSAYPTSTAATWQANQHLLGEDGLLVMSVGAILVRSEATNALIDLGVGPQKIDFAELTGGARKGRMKGGELLSHLAGVGLRPEDIDAVFFSHLHIDHVGWATTGESEEPTFAHAVHYLSEGEYNHWRSPATTGHPSAPTPRQLAAISSRMEFLREGHSPLPRVSVVGTPGHTPGHTSLLISGDVRRALVVGDAAHCPIEILNPELVWVGDGDPSQATTSRHRVSRIASEPDTLVAGVHFPGLIFGQLRNPAQPELSFDHGQTRHQ